MVSAGTRASLPGLHSDEHFDAIMDLLNGMTERIMFSLVTGSSKFHTITSPALGIREASSEDLSHSVIT